MNCSGPPMSMTSSPFSMMILFWAGRTWYIFPTSPVVCQPSPRRHDCRRLPPRVCRRVPKISSYLQNRQNQARSMIGFLLSERNELAKLSQQFESIRQGLKEAIEFSEGVDIGVKVFKPSEIDVKKLRQKIGMTQVEFAVALGISLGTLRHWERRDRTPRGPALVLLNLVQKDPKTILNVLYSCG